MHTPRYVHLDIRKISSERKCAMTRGMAKEKLMENLKTFIGDATRIWNKAPTSIRC